jgi:hypothetical protein
MRLIDADLLVDELEKRIRTPRSTMEIVRDIIPMVDEQPVAYEVDNVLKELKDEKTESYYKSVDGDVFSMGENSAYQKAIEIVKRGGISG